VIVVDANLLLYAYDATSARHAAARAWVEKVFSDAAPVGLPWQTISAFLRIITNVRLPGDRFTANEAAEIVNRWLEQPNVQALGPGEQHWPLFRKMLVEGQAPGPLVSDAHLAALTIECGGVLHTTDRDFARFPGLRWTNPLS
jgi:toxin-antitoxin system PIN domain toxin